METLDSSDTVNGMESSTRTRLLNQVVSFPLRNGRCIDDSGSASTQIHSLFPTHVRGRPQNSTFVVVMQNRPHQSALFFRSGGGGDICSFSAASRFPWRRKFFVKVNWLGWMTFCSTFCFRGHRWHKKTRRRSPIWCGCWLDAVVRTWKKLGVYFPVYLRCT